MDSDKAMDSDDENRPSRD